jgi:TRAP-type mannitol/chloroaromatic compound transport system permease small subunit
MPNLTFTLPHWIYWTGLLGFPLVCIILIHRGRGRRKEGELSYGIAYMFWFMGGIAGLHRLYLKNKGVLMYIPLIVAVLLTNVQIKDAMNRVSGAKNNLTVAEFKLERAQTAAKEEDTVAARSKLEEAQQALQAAREEFTAKSAEENRWTLISTILAIAIGVLLLIDAFLIPRMLRRRAKIETRETKPVQKYQIPDMTEPQVDREGADDPSLRVRAPWLNWIDAVNGYVGEFVCYWSIIAVFVYYYEVIARYIFNSPTNWAHEGMFLMFGMQYMLAAGFTERERGHVNVDIIYKYFPDRVKALVDVFASSLFFIFTVAILLTGWIFLMDSVKVWEVSFTEWGIQYWPVKISIPLGALLITLQGFSRLVKDIIFLSGKRV